MFSIDKYRTAAIFFPEVILVNTMIWQTKKDLTNKSAVLFYLCLICFTIKHALLYSKLL